MLFCKSERLLGKVKYDASCAAERYILKKLSDNFADMLNDVLDIYLGSATVDGVQYDDIHVCVVRRFNPEEVYEDTIDKHLVVNFCVNNGMYMDGMEDVSLREILMNWFDHDVSFTFLTFDFERTDMTEIRESLLKVSKEFAGFVKELLTLLQDRLASYREWWHEVKFLSGMMVNAVLDELEKG